MLHGPGDNLCCEAAHCPTRQCDQWRYPNLYQRMLSEDGVVFAACENTMQKMNVTKEQLLPFVVTVDSGVAQVVRRQEQGWSYIKS